MHGRRGTHTGSSSWLPRSRVLNPSTAIRCELVARGPPLRETPTALGSGGKAGAPSQRLHQHSPASCWTAHACHFPGLWERQKLVLGAC